MFSYRQWMLRNPSPGPALCDWFRQMNRPRPPAGGGPRQSRSTDPPAGSWRIAREMDRMESHRLREDGVRRSRPGPRYFLWVDAVGGFLVCLADQVIVGQAVPGATVDIPILGDLSRRHATLRRQGEDYVIEPNSPVRVDGRTIDRAAALADGDEIELGHSVRLRFRQPHALSATARLDFLSNHRTQPSADAILLMADSCILGPAPGNHVVCRDWGVDVVLFRSSAGQLGCRAGLDLSIDGRDYPGQGPVTGNSRISGSDFALRLEQM